MPEMVALINFLLVSFVSLVWLQLILKIVRIGTLRPGSRPIMHVFYSLSLPVV